MRSRFVRRVTVGFVSAGLAATAVATVALAADHAVDISGFAYGPSRIEIAIGDPITWSNGDAASHTATADDGSWDTGGISNGGSETVTFDTAGTFPYHCEIHPDMTGEVTVVAAGGGGAPTPPTSDTVTPVDDVRPASVFGIAAAIIGLAGVAGALGFGLRVRGRTASGAATDDTPER